MKMPLKSKLIVIVIFLMIVLLLPRAFTKVSETKAMAIVTALGIDLVGEEVELSAQIIIPKTQGGTTQNLMTVASKNTNVASALEDMSTYLGKNIGIEHCDALVLGKNISQKGVGDVLDYFFRGNKIEHNTLLIYFDGKAKELIELTSQIDNSFSLTLDEITKFSGVYFSTLETNLEQFYNEHYSKNKVSVLGGLKIEESDYGLTLSNGQSSGTSGSSSSGGSSGGGSSGGSSSGGSQSGSSQKTKYLINDGETAIFKDWKLARIFNDKETVAMNWFIPESKKYFLRVDNINDNYYDGASVVLGISNKGVRLSTEFVGEKPVLNVELDVDLKMENILSCEKERFKNINSEMFTPMLKSRVIGEIIKDTQKIIKIIKDEKLDVIRLYDKFEKFNYRQLNQFVDTRGIDAFYDELISNIKVNLYEKV